MAYHSDYQERSILSNLKEYGPNYRRLKWPSSDELSAHEARREEILSFLHERAQFGYKETKLDVSRLSAGCQCCGAGEWSCLFINGKCNCRCFYCPAEQNQVGVPTTNRLQFPRPSDYADYVEKFEFKGVGISGGEPLLTFETSLKYIDTLRKRFGDRLYIWIYTNGTLSNGTVLSRLRDVGVNEIRFDIGATHYHLEKVKEAIGVIPTVTVEIPAIPEDISLLKEKAREMADAGVSHLNLHQLRLTPYNFEMLVHRNYTFIHGEKVTVLESEFTALELLRFTFEKGIALPINYCTFHYKHSFQQAAIRRKSANFIVKSHEEVTECGYIRSLSVTGDPAVIAREVKRLERIDGAHNQWILSRSKDHLYFSAALIERIDTENLIFKVTYFEPRILSSISYRNAFVQIPLNRKKTIVVEKAPLGDAMAMEKTTLMSLLKSIERNYPYDEGDPKAKDWERLLSYEMIRPGLPLYF